MCMKDFRFQLCLYEAASAVGTVGLTLGITPKLHILSRSCADHTDVSGTCRRSDADLCSIFRRNTNAKLPLEKITVG